MDARPILHTVARVLAENGLEAILIGNAAAALQGAPVTTVDFDFLIRKTPRNTRRLKAVAKALDAVVFRPFYPSSGMVRMSRDDDGLQLDFMTAIDGVTSFASMRAQSHPEDFGGHTLLVADLPAVAASKRAAGLGTRQYWISWRRRSMKPQRPKRKPSRKQVLAALKAESDRALVDMIRGLLAKPLNERTHFLRKRIGYRASCL